MKLFFKFLPIMLALFVVMPVDAKKKKYPNGDFYEGKWKKGTPHGLGTMKYANGNVYTGNWEFGQYSGQGTMTYANGNVYTGNWVLGQCSGEGIMTYANGNVYTGNWEQGLYNGKGEIKYSEKSDTISFDGNWLKGAQNGEGTLHFRDGDTYVGSWSNGARSGYGVMTYRYKEVSKYEGEWNNDTYGGIGKIEYSNGDMYEGHWKDGKRDGDGTLTKEYGEEIYKGKWRSDGLAEGEITYPQNKTFRGTLEWMKWPTVQYSSGKLTTAKGWYEGTWRNGKFYSGECDITVDGPSYFQGQWKDGMFYEGNINGTVKGNYYNGVFDKGIFIKGDCSIKLTDPDCIHFKGIRDEQGYEGVFTCHSGVSIKGRTDSYFYMDGNYEVEHERFTMSAHIKNRTILSATGRYSPDKDMIFTVQKTPNVTNLVISKGKLKKTKEMLGELTLRSVERTLVILGNQVNDKINSIRREKEEQQAKEQARREELQCAYNSIWPAKDMKTLHKQNSARFRTVFNSSNFALIKGTITDISESEETGFLFDTTWYYVELDGAVLKTSSPSDIARFSKGQTIYAIGEFIGDTYGWYDYPVFKVGGYRYLHAFFASLDEVLKYFADNREKDPESAEKYSFKKLVPRRK